MRRWGSPCCPPPPLCAWAGRLSTGIALAPGESKCRPTVCPAYHHSPVVFSLRPLGPALFNSLLQRGQIGTISRRQRSFGASLLRAVTAHWLGVGEPQKWQACMASG